MKIYLQETHGHMFVNWELPLLLLHTRNHSRQNLGEARSDLDEERALRIGNLFWRPQDWHPLHPLQQGGHPCSLWKIIISPAIHKISNICPRKPDSCAFPKPGNWSMFTWGNLLSNRLSQGTPHPLLSVSSFLVCCCSFVRPSAVCQTFQVPSVVPTLLVWAGFPLVQLQIEPLNQFPLRRQVLLRAMLFQLFFPRLTPILACTFYTQFYHPAMQKWWNPHV